MSRKRSQEPAWASAYPVPPPPPLLHPREISGDSGCSQLLILTVITYSPFLSSLTMVLVEEVPEDILLREDERESDFETDSNASDASIFSDDEDFSPAGETLYDRFVALKDIIPPQTRSNIRTSYVQTQSWAWWGVQSVGTLAWWVSTSALLVGLPLALAIEDETRVVQQEREMQMQSAGQQQVCQPFCTMTPISRTDNCAAPRRTTARARGPSTRILGDAIIGTKPSRGMK